MRTFDLWAEYERLSPYDLNHLLRPRHHDPEDGPYCAQCHTYGHRQICPVVIAVRHLTDLWSRITAPLDLFGWYSEETI